MSSENVVTEKTLLKFDDEDVVVVPVKSKALEVDTAVDPTGEKLAGSQNAQNYQAN